MNKCGMCVAAVVAFAGVASAAIESDSLTASAMVSANTNASVEAVGLELTLDDLDVQETVNATGTAAVNTIGFTDFSLSGLDLDVDDIMLNLSDSDSDSITVFGVPIAGLNVSVDVMVDTVATSISVVGASDFVAINPNGPVTISNLEVNLKSTVTISGNLRAEGTGLAEAIGTIDFPIDPTVIEIDEVFTLPDFEANTTLVGDQLTLSGGIAFSVADINELIGELAGDFPVDLTLPLDLSGGDIEAIIAEIDPDGTLLPEDIEPIIGLIDSATFSLEPFAPETNLVEANFDATFTIPAPGAVAVAGLGGLVASRRRRA